VEWGINGKDELQSLIDSLRVQNTNLGHIRTQRESSQKNTKRQFRKLEATLHPEAMLEKILAIREISKTLYESLAATADCRCHRLNLELQGFLEESGPQSEPCRLVSTGPTATKFRLIMSNDA